MQQQRHVIIVHFDNAFSEIMQLLQIIQIPFYGIGFEGLDRRFFEHGVIHQFWTPLKDVHQPLAKFTKIDGSTLYKDDDLIAAFNEDLVTPVAVFNSGNVEGINLFNVTKLHIMELPESKEHLKQIIGRINRMCRATLLPKSIISYSNDQKFHEMIDDYNKELQNLEKNKQKYFWFTEESSEEIPPSEKLPKKKNKKKRRAQPYNRFTPKEKPKAN